MMYQFIPRRLAAGQNFKCIRILYFSTRERVGSYRISTSDSTPLHKNHHPPHSFSYQLRHASNDVTISKDIETGKVVPIELRKHERQLERFIPVTQQSILKHLLQDTHLLSTEDKKSLGTLVSSLDAKYSQSFYSILEECKVCDIIPSQT